MDFHTIRLLTPWEVGRFCEGESETTLHRVTLPCQFQQPDSGWPVYLRRRFNSPSGLSASSRIFLRVFWVAGTLAVRLNGHVLTPCDVPRTSFRTTNLEHGENRHSEVFEITAALRPGSLIEIELAGLTEPAVYATEIPRLPELKWVSLEIAES
jgi:hypothetical protein